MQLSYSVRNLHTMLLNECVIVKLIPVICITHENYENVKAVVLPLFDVILTVHLR